MFAPGLVLEARWSARWTGETWSGTLAGRPVVVKRVDEAADPFAAARLAREVVALRRSQDDGVPEVLVTGRSGPWAYAAFDRIDGGDLRRVRPTGPISAAGLASALEPVARVLARAHTAGVVHRDLSPGNVVLGPAGGVVVDFGACALDGAAFDGWSGTGTPLAVATEGFTPPEGPGSTEPTRDVWAFGALVAWCVERFGVGPEGRGALDDIADECCAADPARRPTMAAVAARLVAIAGDEGSAFEHDVVGVRGADDPASATEGPARKPSIANDGREAEVTVLTDALQAARAADGLAVHLLLGRAGIGKSWLVERLARTVEPTGVAVLRARCTQEVGDIRALRGWTAGEAVGRATPLTAQFAALTGSLRGGPLDLDAERIPQVVAAYLRTHGPVLAIVEDMHHATPDLVRLIESLPRQGFAAGMLVLTARPGFVDPDDLDAATLPVGPLPQDTIRRLLPEGHSPDVEEILVAADGNPLTALALAAAGSEGLTTEATLAGAVTARLARLPVEREAMLLAAASGETVWPEAIGARLSRAVPELLRSGVLRVRLGSEVPTSTEFEWTHPVLREVAYAGFDAAARAGGHAEVATAFAAWPGVEVEHVAYHGLTAHRLGDRRTRDLTITYAERSVDAAADRAAAPAAAAWLDAIREVGGRPSPTTRERLGDVAAQVGDLPVALRGYADAVLADREDRLSLARRLRKIANVLKERGEPDRTARWLGFAQRQIRGLCAGAVPAATVEAQVEAVELSLTAASAAFYRSDLDGSGRLAHAALEGAERLADPGLVGRAYLQLEMVASEAGDPERSRFAEAALAALERAQDDRAIADLRTNLGVSAHDAGDYDGAMAHYAVVLDLADRRNDAIGRAIAHNNLAETLTTLGRLDEAAGHLDEADTLFAACRYDLGGAAVHAARARIALWQGEPGTAAAHLDEAESRYRRLDVPVYLADLHLRRAEWAVLMGRPIEARYAIVDARRTLDEVGSVATLESAAARLAAAVEFLEGNGSAGIDAMRRAGERAAQAGLPYEAALATTWCAQIGARTGDPAEVDCLAAWVAVDRLAVGLIPVLRLP